MEPNQLFFKEPISKKLSFSFDKNKLKNLEDRLLGPNSEGKAPFEAKTLENGQVVDLINNDNNKNKENENENYNSNGNIDNYDGCEKSANFNYCGNNTDGEKYLDNSRNNNSDIFNNNNNINNRDKINHFLPNSNSKSNNNLQQLNNNINTSTNNTKKTYGDKNEKIDKYLTKKRKKVNDVQMNLGAELDNEKNDVFFTENTSNNSSTSSVNNNINNSFNFNCEPEFSGANLTKETLRSFFEKSNIKKYMRNHSDNNNDNNANNTYNINNNINSTNINNNSNNNTYNTYNNNNNNNNTIKKKNSSKKLSKNYHNININNSPNNIITIKELRSIIDLKDKQIRKLQNELTEKTYVVNQNRNYIEQLERENRICHEDISRKVLEIEELKRKLKKKWINEQEFNIGRVHKQILSDGKLMDVWIDSENISNIKQKLEQIKIIKEEIERNKKKLYALRNKTSASISNNNSGSNDQCNNNSTPSTIEEEKEILDFKLSELNKQEYKLNEELSMYGNKKSELLHELNLLNLENKSNIYNKYKKWPLLEDRYQIISLLGKGGFSEVYKAYDLSNHQYVACKIHQLNQLWRDEIKENYIKHTLRENEIYKNLNNNKIIKFYDTIKLDNNSFCTVLEYCSGPDLAFYIKQNSYITEKEGRFIITQILEGLKYLNNLDKKIIHYDLKPENIIFNNMEVKISDFGLAKIIDNVNDNSIQLTTFGAGTYWYLPPECFDNGNIRNITINNKVDIWSCGVILYEMLYKEKPFGKNCSQDRLIRENIIANARYVSFPAKPVVSDECKNFIRKCLEYNQSDRYDVFQALASPFIKDGKRYKKTNK